MGNVVDEVIPLELMRPDRLFETIDFIRSKRLPSAFARMLLQQWGDAVGAALDPTAYKLVVRRVE